MLFIGVVFGKLCQLLLFLCNFHQLGVSNAFDVLASANLGNEVKQGVSIGA